MSEYWVERRDNGGTWYRYTSNNNIAAAEYSADGVKRQHPDSQVRITDSRGNIKGIR